MTWVETLWWCAWIIVCWCLRSLISPRSWNTEVGSQALQAPIIRLRPVITCLHQKYITWSVLTWSLYSKAKLWRHIKTRNSIEFVGKSKNRIFCKYRCRDEFGFSSRISSYEYIYFNALKVYVSISILACFIAPNLALQYGVWHTWRVIQRFNVPVLAGTHKKYQVE